LDFGTPLKTDRQALDTIYLATLYADVHASTIVYAFSRGGR
jgi:hypothetical protein